MRGIAGPNTTMKIGGKIRKAIGKSILIGAVRASVSARWRLRRRISSPVHGGGDRAKRETEGAVTIAQRPLSLTSFDSSPVNGGAKRVEQPQ